MMAARAFLCAVTFLTLLCLLKSADGQLSFGSPKVVLDVADPWALAVDPVSRALFLGNYESGSVSRFPSVDSLSTSSKPDAVFNQAGGYKCNAENDYYPYQISYDNYNDILYVADSDFARVLCFRNATTSNLTRADFVIGQTNLTYCQVHSNEIYGAIVDQNDNLWVSINGYVKGFRSASTLSGAFPTPFASVEIYGTGLFPFNLDYDPITDSLYVAAETYVYRYDNVNEGLSTPVIFGTNSTSEPADNNIAYSYTGLVDEDGNLYVVDYSWNRVLIFLNARNVTKNHPVADLVLGQPNFTTISTTELDGPGQIFWDPVEGNLYVLSYKANQVIVYHSNEKEPSRSPSPSPSPSSSSSTNEGASLRSSWVSWCNSLATQFGM